MSEQLYLYQLRLPAARWIAALEQVNQASPLAYLYAEEAANLHLAYYRRPEPQWTHGRAFNEVLEVRWNRCQEGQVDLLLLTERPFSNQDNWQTAALLPDDSANNEVVVEPGQIMLLGFSRRHKESPYGDDPNAPKLWADSRAQRFVAYPLNDQESRRRWAVIKIKTYRVNGCPVAYRMASLEGTDHVKKL
jgi:hypothetical protein